MTRPTSTTVRFRRNATITALAGLAGLVAGLLPAPSSSAAVVRSADAAPGRYLVVLHESGLAPPAGTALGGPGVADLARTLGRQHRAQVGRHFESALAGFAAEMDAAAAEQLSLDPRVAQVVEDARIRITSDGTSGGDAGSWGLDRIDQRNLPLDARFEVSGEGIGVDLFIVDTGVRSTHHEVLGRVDTGVAFTAIADGNGSEDCNGHGTHVAGVAAGATLGVAGGVMIHPVRVLDCSGSGYISDVVAGIDWLTATYVDGKGKGRWATNRPAVANVSLEAARHTVLDQAVAGSIAAGVSFVVAAGNSGTVACNRSPAAVLTALTVGATDPTDARASFSNYGRCVDLFAPGTSIVSASILGDEEVFAMSGTSAAAPHVAGVVATYLANHPTATPAEVHTAITYHGSSGVLGGGTGSPDLMLYSRFEIDGVDEAPLARFVSQCRIAQRDCQFDASGSFDDEGIVSYDWDFGDGTTSRRSAMTQSHKFPRDPGQFLVTLTTTDTAGQATSYQGTVLFSH